jgi:hypothetical protein
VKEDNETHSIPTIINRQISRKKIRRVTKQRMLVQGGDMKPTMNECSGKTVSTSKHKVVILGDSHLKGSVPRIDNYLNSKFEVNGFIKLGAGFEEIVGKSILGLSRLAKMCLYVMVVPIIFTVVTQKIIILQIMKFFQDNDKSNIIMVDIPHRYDLPDNSHVNKAFNSKLKKIAKLFKYVKILEFNFTRKCFTQHGLHLNGYGKGLLAKQMASLIYKMSCQKTEKPIVWNGKCSRSRTPMIHLLLLLYPKNWLNFESFQQILTHFQPVRFLLHRQVFRH